VSYHIVRKIKRCYHHTSVANAMHAAGYVWRRKPPTNIDRMLEGVPRCDLEFILQYLEAS